MNSEKLPRKGVWLREEDGDWFYTAVPDQFNPTLFERSELPNHWSNENKPTTHVPNSMILYNDR